jgi:hypothetical protein
MEYFVCLPNVGIKHLADVGIEEEEEGNHLRKEPVPYCVNYKESVPSHVGAPLMSIRHLLHCNLCS